jgi:tRNA-specific adenosine deaminase 1
MKCLPQKHISRAQGVVLHDWHAEILAIRSFNRFILEECQALADFDKTSSEYIHLRDESRKSESQFQPFALNDDIDIYMYCSEAPCAYLFSSFQKLVESPLMTL